MSAEIVVFPSPAAVAEALADRTAQALRDALSAEPRVSLCLTGGSTPVPAYRRLAQAEGIEWDRVHVFWGDERAVGPDDEHSNFRMARETLLDGLDLPSGNVHRIEGERGAEGAAVHYEGVLERFFGDAPARFDVLHLGMGDDGHTASLFPGAAALEETDRRAVATVAPPSSPVTDRITLTFPVLNSADRLLLAAAGSSKREAFAAAIDAIEGGSEGPPVARLRPQAEWVWLVDQALAQGPLDDA